REAVANAAHGPNEHRPLRVITELLTHAAHEHIDGAVVCLGVDAAHRLHDAVARQHASAVSYEKTEELELGGREEKRAPFQRSGASHPVQLQWTDAHDVLLLVCAPTQDGLHPGDELARLKRLRQIVIRAELEANDAIGHVATSRQHDYWHATGFAHLA